MDYRSAILWICLLVFVGSSGLIVNEIYPNNSNIVIGAVALSGSFCLFVAVVAESISYNVVSAIRGKQLEAVAGSLTTVLARTIHDVMKDEQDEKKN